MAGENAYYKFKSTLYDYSSNWGNKKLSAMGVSVEYFILVTKEGIVWCTSAGNL